MFRCATSHSRSSEMKPCNVTLSIGEDEATPASIVKYIEEKHRLPLTISDFSSEVTLEFKPNVDAFAGKVSPKYCHLKSTEDSEVSSISACSATDVAGVIHTRGRFYILYTEGGRVFLIPQSHDTCDFVQRTKRAATKKKPNGLPDYYREYLGQGTRYVELALFADNSMYKKYGESAQKVEERLKSIANHVNALYTPLNIIVQLVYHETWVDADKFEVLTSGDKTLGRFLEYRKTTLEKHPHDNAHLLTDIRFEEGVVGKAFKGTMCSLDYSGGVDVDHNDSPAMVAATVAHELGHNFGMGHDPDYTTTCKCQGEQCLMFASAAHYHVSYWSTCSLKQLFDSLNRGTDFCLQNNPEVTISDPGKCGNGVVDAGEECDCGSEICPHSCCNGATCKLTQSSECAAGGCCDISTCKKKTRANVCRASTNVCDLPEFCNGETAECPGDFFAQDGSLCPGRSDEYCFNGICGSRNDQCTMIWGAPSSDAHPICYNVNVRGEFQGNCGTSEHDEGHFIRCEEKDKMCGRLQCKTESERPIFGDPTTVTSGYTTWKVGGLDQRCSMMNSKYRGGKREKEPGLVFDGATCGDDSVCVDRKCIPLKNATLTTTDCEKNCSDKGVCNNVGNCHCEIGYGGVDCGIPGYGGSVNSNPAALSRGFSTLYVAIAFLLLSGFIFVGLTVYYKRKKNVWLPSKCWKWTKSTLNLRGILVPVRKAPPPPGGHRKMKKDSLNAGWGEHGAAVTYRSSENAAPQLLFNSPNLPAAALTSTTAYHPHTEPHGFHQPSMGMGYPAQAVISPHRTGVSVSRTNSLSLRPTDPPPNVPLRPRDSKIKELYDERAEELGFSDQDKKRVTDGYVLPPAKDIPKEVHKPQLPIKPPKKIERVESINRPGAKPPPPPPKNLKPPMEMAPKPKLLNKPLPKEPSDDEESQSVSVKDIKAMFDKK